MTCTLETDPVNLSIEPEQSTCNMCDDWKDLIDELKAKCTVASKQEVVQLLTIAPTSWSISTVAEEFKVSEYLVRKARNLRETSGILANAERKKGHALSTEIEAAVKSFYEDDEFSRICPGKKDYVSVRVDGQKQHFQKRLILCNLNELYASFKQKTSMRIGFSKFCELRPKWCVTVGSAGSHTVCVCVYISPEHKTDAVRCQK